MHGNSNGRPKRIERLIAFLVFGWMVSSPTGALALPQVPYQANVPDSSIPAQQLDALEQRFLQRTFAHDPVDKRLQRLELLVFGMTQYGSVDERWSRLRQSLNQAHTALRPSKPTTDEMMLLNALEKQVFKRSNASEPTASRVDKLEAKLFGQPSPNMSLAQRLERMRKTIGLSDPLTAARPGDRLFGNGPGRSFSMRLYGSPGVLSQVDPNVNEMLKEMDRQMRQLQGFGDRSFDDDEWLTPPPNKDFHFHYEYTFPPSLPPSLPPSPKGPSINIPGKGSGTRRAPDIPPYGDPNSI